MKLMLTLFLSVSALAIDVKVTREDDKVWITKYKMATKEDGTSVNVEHNKYSVSEQFLLIEKQRLVERIAEIDLILSEINKLRD